MKNYARKGIVTESQFVPPRTRIMVNSIPQLALPKKSPSPNPPVKK